MIILLCLMIFYAPTPLNLNHYKKRV